jgi:hypothetical protein
MILIEDPHNEDPSGILPQESRTKRISITIFNHKANESDFMIC